MSITIDPSQIKNNYPNPLDNYRSYSYQFIMTLASTTQAFREMMGASLDQPAPLLSSVLQAKKPGEAFTVGSSKAYLLLDTRRFSQYGITSLEMEHIYGSGNAANPTVPVNTTHMQLIDTTGMSFFNMLMDLFRNKLQTTRSSAFFMLAILFVGHKDDGTTEVVSTCFIPLMMLTMGFTLNFKGSEYEIDFMEVEGAPAPGAAMEIMNNRGDVQIKSTVPTIGGMINSLEQELNIQSLGWYQKYSNDALNQNNNAKLGKLVQYMITVPKEWQDYDVSLAGRSKNKEQMFIAATKQTDVTKDDVKKHFDLTKFQSSGVETQMSFAPTVTITDAITNILESSLSFLNEASEEKRRSGKAIVYKTITTITSDDTSYIVHFDVFPHYLPKIEPDAKAGADGNANTSILNSGTKNVIGSSNSIRNLMTYNYLFTGKNSHIIDLKIQYLPESAIALDTNMELGQARFATVSAAGQSKQNVEKVSEGTKKTTSFSPDLRAGDPIFFPFKSQDQQNNIATHKNEQMSSDQAVDAFRKKQEFTQTYAYIHFLSSLELDMTIRGNPNIIRKYADRKVRGGIAPHYAIIDTNSVRQLTSSTTDAATNFNRILAQNISSGKQKYYAEYVQPRIAGYTKANTGTDPLLDGPDVAIQPVFCKMNILAPNVDYTGDYISNEPMFTDKFFFNGPYMVLYIKTQFSAGEFTHTLSMIPYDVSGTITANDQAAKPNSTVA